jgi:hypothetical protein
MSCAYAMDCSSVSVIVCAKKCVWSCSWSSIVRLLVYSIVSMFTTSFLFSDYYICSLFIDYRRGRSSILLDTTDCCHLFIRIVRVSNRFITIIKKLAMVAVDLLNICLHLLFLLSLLFSLIDRQNIFTKLVRFNTNNYCGQRASNNNLDLFFILFLTIKMRQSLLLHDQQP